MGSLFPMLSGNSPFVTEFSSALCPVQFLKESLSTAFSLSLGRKVTETGTHIKKV